MKRILLPVFVLMGVVILSATAAAQSGASQSAKKSESTSLMPARKVKGRTLTSVQLPPVGMTFDKAFKYVGAQSFVLYGVANAEQHFFVDADKQGRMRRFYWVQFEGYLPDNKHTYNHSSKKIANIGGLNFFADAHTVNLTASGAAQRADSDGARARSFLESKGYRMANDDVLMQRLVHMTDETNRHELMIIYIEDLSVSGLSAAHVSEKGRDAARWETISNELLERAVKSLKLVRR